MQEHRRRLGTRPSAAEVTLVEVRQRPRDQAPRFEQADGLLQRIDPRVCGSARLLGGRRLGLARLERRLCCFGLTLAHQMGAHPAAEEERRPHDERDDDHDPRLRGARLLAGRIRHSRSA